MDNSSSLLGALRQAIRETESDGGALRRSPHLEATLQTVTEAAQSGAMEQGLQAVAQQRERLEMARQDLETHAQGVPADTTAAAIVQRIRDLYAANARGLDTLETATRRADSAALAEAADVLRRNLHDLMECHEAWKSEMSILEAEAGGTVAVSEAYAKLYQASDQLALGQLDVKDWLRVLEPLEHDLLAMQQKLDEGLGTLSIKLAEDAYASSIAAEIQLALQEGVQGLRRMRDYSVAHEVAALNEGWTRLVAGNVRMQKAMHTMAASQGMGGDVVILEDE